MEAKTINRITRTSLEKLIKCSLATFREDSENPKENIRYDFIIKEVSTMLEAFLKAYNESTYVRKSNRLPDCPKARFFRALEYFIQDEILTEDEMFYAASVVGFAGDMEAGNLMVQDIKGTLKQQREFWAKLLDEKRI